MSNVPKLRFKEFSGKWEKKTVGDVGKVSMCKRILKDQTTSDGDIPFYKIGTFGKEPDAFISKVIFEEFKAKYSFPKEGEILISASGTIGRTVIYDGSPSYFQDSNIVWIANNEKLALNKFLLYCYENTRWNTENTTIARLYNENLRNIPLILPSKQEQDKIASFLTSVDTKIEQLSRKEELLQQYKKGVMQKIFSQEIRFKADDGSEFCEWEEKKLGQIGKFYAGGDLTKLNYSKEKSNEYVYPIYANGSGEGLYGYATTFQYKSNCVTVSGRGTLGHANLRKENFNAIVRLIVIEPKSNICGNFLKEAINRINFSIESTGVPQLTIPQISLYKVFLPCLEEQNKIANFLSSIDTKIQQTQKQLESSKEFKKALLQQMFV
ncbi:restriction endonuclease subunit S [Arcobacter porcinus]|uniref:Type I restriction/modification system, specificity subunit n=1 Tax=Arcobacter porcinus TaxID=1935204 RepID=A0A5C2HF26_9BACT|nr:restriction endonuclease subunit S [Arcobacter porcinus]QEP41005.1 type I restriction/modification system, specificity subunit [Arcobacter porcinus]